MEIGHALGKPQLLVLVTGSVGIVVYYSDVHSNVRRQKHVSLLAQQISSWVAIRKISKKSSEERPIP
jgi:hypothetical protein